MLIFILIVNSALSYALTQDEKKKYDELEGLPFIKALVQDKKFAAVIEEFPAVFKQKENLGELYYNLALSHFFLKHYELAFKSLKKSESLKKNDDDFYKLWARSAHALKRFNICVDHFQKVKLEHIEGTDWILFADCLEKNSNKNLLLKVFFTHKSNDEDFFLTQQNVLLKNGLYSYANEYRESYLESCKPNPKSYMSLWNLIDSFKFSDQSILETAHACHPAALEITSLLVKNLFSQGKFHSIAYLFETISASQKEYLKHTAEFYKVAGRNYVADYYFSLGDESGFLLSQSSKFLNAENYASLITIPFKRSMILGNTDLAYALGYSQFKYNNLEGAKKSIVALSKKTTRDELLLKLIDKCTELDWRCRP